MANRNTQGFGLIAAGALGSTPATSGQGKYKIDAGYGTSIFHGGAVASAAGYIIEGQGTDTPILGVLNGIFYIFNGKSGFQFFAQLFLKLLAASCSLLGLVNVNAFKNPE